MLVYKSIPLPFGLLLFHFLLFYSFTLPFLFPFFALLFFTLLVFPFVLFCSLICDVARTSEVPQLNFDPLAPDPPLRRCSFSMARVGKHNASINIKCSCQLPWYLLNAPDPSLCLQQKCERNETINKSNSSQWYIYIPVLVCKVCIHVFSFAQFCSFCLDRKTVLSCCTVSQLSSIRLSSLKQEKCVLQALLSTNFWVKNDLLKKT